MSHVDASGAWVCCGENDCACHWFLTDVCVACGVEKPGNALHGDALLARLKSPQMRERLIEEMKRVWSNTFGADYLADAAIKTITEALTSEEKI